MITMMTLVVLIMLSVGIVHLMHKFETPRLALRNLTACYAQGTCRSFILDIFVLIPLVGIIVEALAKRLDRWGASKLLLVIEAVILVGSFMVLKATLGGLMFILIMVVISVFSLLFLIIYTSSDPRKGIRAALYAAAIGIFVACSGSLYFDCLNFSFLAPILGHPGAWSGNHFMWNSGIELLGFRPLVSGEPTYRNFFGALNLSGLFTLFVVYGLEMVIVGYRFHGMLFGYTKKQTGVSALFIERNID